MCIYTFLKVWLVLKSGGCDRLYCSTRVCICTYYILYYYYIYICTSKLYGHVHRLKQTPIRHAFRFAMCRPGSPLLHRIQHGAVTAVLLLCEMRRMADLILRHALRFDFENHISMDWFKGKSRGNQKFSNGI